MKGLTAVLAEQFGRAFGLLEEQVRAFPEGELLRGHVELLVPSRVVYHAIETLDYYTSEELAAELRRRDLPRPTWR